MGNTQPIVASGHVGEKICTDTAGALFKEVTRISVKESDSGANDVITGGICYRTREILPNRGDIE